MYSSRYIRPLGLMRPSLAMTEILFAVVVPRQIAALIGRPVLFPSAFSANTDLKHSYVALRQVLWV
jgi:hypothetical protein